MEITILLTFLVSTAHGLITLPKFFTDDMVLQQAPSKAHIWGHTNDNDLITVYVFCDDFPYIFEVAPKIDGSFTLEIGPIEGGNTCNIDLVQGNEIVSLHHVLFGDIWICSGQSNMQWPMSDIFNASYELAVSSEFDNIRMYKAPHQSSETELDDLLEEDWDSWSDPSDLVKLQDFSAVCFLFARSISERLGKSAKYFGLILTSWGGTRIEPWSPPESLERCDVANFTDPDNSKTSNSHLYNGMIHPFTKMSIYGALWYQGESNTDWNIDKYQCTFPEMIRAWRSRWIANSPTSQDFPFGFVQLAANKENFFEYGVPLIRWHQTGDWGTVPNSDMENTFMAVALDTHDPESSLHPRNKQIVGSRLGISGLNIAYGMTEYPTRGPYPGTITFDNSGPMLFAHAIYDQEFSYSPRGSNSSFYECTMSSFEACDSPGSWQMIDLANVMQMSPNEMHVTLSREPMAIGFAYLWNESPVLVPLGAPIYSPDEFALPGGPWKVPVSL